jgi:hypothetical protein
MIQAPGVAMLNVIYTECKNEAIMLNFVELSDAMLTAAMEQHVFGCRNAECL